MVNEKTNSPISMTQESETTRPYKLCDTCREPSEMEFHVPGMGWRRIPVECKCSVIIREKEKKEHLLNIQRRKLMELRRSWRMEDFPVVDQTFDHWDHANQPVMDDIFWRIKSFAANFARYKPRTGLLLLGKNGTGKSYLLNALTRYVSEDLLIPAISVEAVELLDRLKPKRDDDNREADWFTLRNIDLLCINDIAAVHATPWAVEKLFQLLTARAGKATCASMNENPFAWADRGGSPIERIRSRLEEAMDWIAIPETACDYRHVLRRERAIREGRSVPK